MPRFGLVGQAVEQCSRMLDAHLRITELVLVRREDTAAQLLGHALHAVTDTEHRLVELEERVGYARCPSGGHRLGTPRENHASHLGCSEQLGVEVMGFNLAIDASLAHAARNQLRILRAEIENEDLLAMDIDHQVLG